MEKVFGSGEKAWKSNQTIERQRDPGRNNTMWNPESGLWNIKFLCELNSRPSRCVLCSQISEFPMWNGMIHIIYPYLIFPSVKWKRRDESQRNLGQMKVKIVSCKTYVVILVILLIYSVALAEKLPSVLHNIL